MLMNYDSENVERKIESKTHDRQFILNVVNIATSYHGRKLLRNEVEGLVHYIREIDFSLMRDEPIDVISDNIAKNFVLQMGRSTNATIDTHEVMKRHIGTINPGDPESMYATDECAPYSATYGIKDPGILDTFKNDRREGLPNKARNTDKTNK